MSLKLIASSAVCQSDAPPLAHIEEVTVAAVEPTGDAGFVIRPSLDAPGKLVPVSPDVSTCEDCMRDFRTPAGRRYGYPFTNCTNCGPRYTITREIPYDRPLTTMACFAMCERCVAEYEDPDDRRFHAQPNACPDCGPALALVLREELGDARPQFATAGDNLAAIREVRALLRQRSNCSHQGARRLSPGLRSQPGCRRPTVARSEKEK